MNPASMAELEAAIALVASRCLAARGGPAASIGSDTPLALLGLDSLGTIELGAALEAALGLEIPPDVVADAGDVRALALALAGSARPSRADDRLARMRADAMLPDDVRPSGGPGPCRVRGPGPCRVRALEDCRAVLVTGATGFLGATIVRELLERSRAHVHCVVRRGARDRVVSRLREAGLNDRAFASRLHVVDADLSRPRLGLSPAAFAELAREADAICHAGADVNWVYGYETLAPTNVGGTLELIRLASRRSIPFHFVSSLSVCYSTAGPRHAPESYEALAHLGGVHLGYAQTKIVAEALVHQAHGRGLPTAVHRPAILAGDSVTGRFNPDDVLAALVRGTVRMGAAPDLDWQLDCVPVDVAARAIVRLEAADGVTWHLKHPRPRHWRECVLWMRLYGYPLKLVPLHAWLRQLDADTRADADHPLRPLRSFFLDRITAAGGLTLPELYEDSRRTQAVADRTERAAAGAGIVVPPLDAALLDRYFAAYTGSGFLPPPAASGFSRTAVAAASSRTASDDFASPGFFTRLLGTRVYSATRLSSGSGFSVISELAAWRTCRPAGLFRYRLEFEHRGERVARDVMVKAKPPDVAAIEVGEAIARVADDRLGEAYATWADRIGLLESHRRELGIYAQTDARFTRHAPALLGARGDDDAGMWILALEHVSDGVLMDAVDRPRAWSRGHLSRVVRGLAALQAIWLGRERDLRDRPWIGHVQSSPSMAEMAGLWRALAAHAAPAFSAWAGPSIGRIAARLIDGVDRWWGALETGPRTLIHHDFNPRNLCLRRHARTLRLCAYDWELATAGAPQHDLAELLCFVLSPDAPGSEIDFWIEQHRRALSREAGCELDPRVWRDGFQASIFDLIVNRLPMYALVHRIRRQSFLPRVVQTWLRLYQHVRRDEAS